MNGDYPLITCEHGGNHVPPEYEHLFAEPEHQERLQTHRGYDFGALVLGQQMAEALHAPYFSSTTSRLLVDLNRSVGHPTLHSESTRGLPLAERRRIVEHYWQPHRTKVEDDVAQAIGRGFRVVHVASHSFTPELHGEVRKADVGLLYDPRRPTEKILARLWKQALEARDHTLRVRLNYPYRGGSDGLTNALRKRWPPAQYVGMEFELNQQFLVDGGARLAQVRATVVDTLVAAMAEFAASAHEGHPD